MRIRLLKVLCFVALTSIGSLPVKAAEIRAMGDTYEAVFEGKIEIGDFEKLRSFVFGHITQQIYLASPGGDLAEAMKIGRLVRSLNMETIVPGAYPSQLNRMHSFLHDLKANYMCTSACFFVYVAGIERFVDSPLGKAFLGIHRPYLSESDLQSATSDEAIASMTYTKSMVENYLKEMGVPTKYSDEMFSISKNDIRWISDDEIQADFNGFIPELRDWVDARCDKFSDIEKNIWEQFLRGKIELTPAAKAMAETLIEKYRQQGQCESKLQSKLAFQAYAHAFELQDQSHSKNSH
jgi:hypothetical protein